MPVVESSTLTGKRALGLRVDQSDTHRSVCAGLAYRYTQVMIRSPVVLVVNCRPSVVLDCCRCRLSHAATTPTGTWAQLHDKLLLKLHASCSKDSLVTDLKPDSVDIKCAYPDLHTRGPCIAVVPFYDGAPAPASAPVCTVCSLNHFDEQRII